MGWKMWETLHCEQGLDTCRNIYFSRPDWAREFDGYSVFYELMNKVMQYALIGISAINLSYIYLPIF